MMTENGEVSKSAVSIMKHHGHGRACSLLTHEAHLCGQRRVLLPLFFSDRRHFYSTLASRDEPPTQAAREHHRREQSHRQESAVCYAAAGLCCVRWTWSFLPAPLRQGWWRTVSWEDVFCLGCCWIVSLVVSLPLVCWNELYRLPSAV